MSKVKLYKYHEEAFNNTMEIYKSSNRACVIMATGTGKSYVMMRLLEEFDKEDGKAYILTPNNPTKEQTIDKMVEWEKAVQNGTPAAEITDKQIREYFEV